MSKKAVACNKHTTVFLEVLQWTPTVWLTLTVDHQCITALPVLLNSKLVKPNTCLPRLKLVM